MGQFRQKELQTLLKTILGSDNVYFQPPSNLKMQYPAIVYKIDNMATEFAGNRPYSLTDRYAITIIDRMPDSPIPRKIASLPQTVFVRAFQSNDLNHTIYATYF